MDSVGGIQVEDGTIVIQPFTDQRLGSVSAVYDSPYGRIVSEWNYKNHKIIYHFEIPSNMEAKIVIPDMDPQIVAAGSYDYEVLRA